MNAVLKIKITICVANRETRSVLTILTILTELLRPARQFFRSLRLLLLLLLLLLHTTIVFSLGGSSFYTSTEKSNKNKYNIKKQSGKEADRQTEYTT